MKPSRRSVFFHHIYELKKGLRSLILFTTKATNREVVIKKLETNGIDYLIHPVEGDPGRINIYFGNRSCIEVLKRIDKQNLSELNPEEDFILGIMLGYSRLKQCERYLRRKDRRPVAQVETPALDPLGERD